MTRWILGLMGWVALAAGVSCSSVDAEAPDASEDGVVTTSDADTEADAPTPLLGGPAARHTFDPERAARGERLLTTSVLGDGLVPRLALENLWIAWGDLFPTTGDAYWERFRERYGMFEAPFDNSGYPMGIRDAGGGQASFDCLLCHAGVVAGETHIGVANTTLRLQRLHDDLVTLNARAPDYGYPSLPVPFTLTDRTGAPGATDAFGLGMELSLRYGPPGADINTHYGYQRPNAWWTLRYKDRIYSDGSGAVGGHRTMMATLLAFGLSWTELQAMDNDFDDLQHFLLSLEPPEWPRDIDTDAATRGSVLFSERCADCHGDAERGFPDRLVDLDAIGTDPTRALRFTEAEAAWINASWFGNPPMTSTQAYVAPPLVGIWARAPYFHNGSVPTLRAVIDPSARPSRWKRTGSTEADFDFDAVGWRVDTQASGEGVYDTSVEGLGADGHRYGEGLDEAAVAELLEYLKTL